MLDKVYFTVSTSAYNFDLPEVIHGNGWLRTAVAARCFWAASPDIFPLVRLLLLFRIHFVLFRGIIINFSFPLSRYFGLASVALITHYYCFYYYNNQS